MSGHDEARAQHLWESLKCDEDPVPLIAAALNEARRDTWEAAAKMQCLYCNDPVWIARSKHGDHLSPITGMVFECASKKLLAMAEQAEKEDRL